MGGILLLAFHCCVVHLIMKIHKDCHVALFDQALIVLNEKRGAYLLYDEQCASAFAKWYGASPRQWHPQLQKLLDDRVLIYGDESTQAGACRDHRSLRFDKFGTDVWSHRTLSCSAGSDVDLKLIARLSWSALALKLFGFRSVRALGNINVDNEQTLDRLEIQSLQVPERYLQASIWSPLRIRCMQMSLAITSELRRHGVNAHFVIGVRPLPFVAHAWVEVGGDVWGDESGVQSNYGEIYRVPKGK